MVPWSHGYIFHHCFWEYVYTRTKVSGFATISMCFHIQIRFAVYTSKHESDTKLSLIEYKSGTKFRIPNFEPEEIWIKKTSRVHVFHKEFQWIYTMYMFFKFIAMHFDNTPLKDSQNNINNISVKIMLSIQWQSLCQGVQCNKRPANP